MVLWSGLDRELFLKRFDSEKTRKKYETILSNLDDYLKQKNTSEDDFKAMLNNLPINDRYNILQDLVYFLSAKLSPRSTRNYFDALFKYLLYSGFELDYTQRRIRVQFPRIASKRFEGLDRGMIKTLLDNAKPKLGLYLRVLAGGGFRESEALQLKPKHIMFDEMPARVLLDHTMTKFSIGRETFLPENTVLYLKSYIRLNNIGNDDYIFTKKYHPRLVFTFDKAFDVLRRRVGLEKQDRKKHEHNDIKLHSFRAWFITTWTELGKPEFGHALAGHSKELSVYYRTSKQTRSETFLQYQSHFDF